MQDANSSRHYGGRAGCRRTTRFPSGPRGPQGRESTGCGARGRGRGRKSRVVTAAGVRSASRRWLLRAVSVGSAAAMAVDTLSPDWEFDRVDDGSQSKPPASGEAGRVALRTEDGAVRRCAAARSRSGLSVGWDRTRSERCVTAGVASSPAHALGIRPGGG